MLPSEQVTKQKLIYCEVLTELNVHLFSELKGMREVEQILIEKSRGRELPTEEEIEEYRVAEQLIEPFTISDEEGAAEINRNNAMQLLHV